MCVGWLMGQVYHLSTYRTAKRFLRQAGTEAPAQLAAVIADLSRRGDTEGVERIQDILLAVWHLQYTEEAS